MSVVSIVLGFLPDAADIDTHLTLLGIGLFALAVAALQKEGNRKTRSKTAFALDRDLKGG
jgi:hypothetical protein